MKPMKLTSAAHTGVWAFRLVAISAIALGAVLIGGWMAWAFLLVAMGIVSTTGPWETLEDHLNGAFVAIVMVGLILAPLIFLTR